MLRSRFGLFGGAESFDSSCDIGLPWGVWTITGKAWLAIPSGTRAKAVGLGHGLSNVLMVALFAVGWSLRTGAPGDPGILPIVLSFLGAGLASLGGYLGGELVFRLGIGVAEGGKPERFRRGRRSGAWGTY